MIFLSFVMELIEKNRIGYPHTKSDTPQIVCEELCPPYIFCEQYDTSHKLKKSKLLKLPKMCLNAILKPLGTFYKKCFLNFLRRIK